MQPETSTPAPAQRLFWRSCLVLIPLALPACFLPYAQVRLATGLGYLQADVFSWREYPAVMLITVTASAFTIWWAVKSLRSQQRTRSSVVYVTIGVMLFALGAAGEAAQSNNAPWRDGHDSDVDWFPTDGGRETAPYQVTLHRLADQEHAAAGGKRRFNESETIEPINVRRHGPWMPLAALSLTALSFIGVFACWRPVCDFAHPILPTMLLSAITLVPFLFLMWLEMVAVTGALS